MELVCVRALIFIQFDSELKALILNFNSVMIENMKRSPFLIVLILESRKVKKSATFHLITFQSK